MTDRSNNEDQPTHATIFREIGVLSATVDAIKHELHEVRVEAKSGEARILAAVHDVTTTQKHQGARIAMLEKQRAWVIGAAIGILFIIGLVALNFKEFIHKITGGG